MEGAAVIRDRLVRRLDRSLVVLVAVLGLASLVVWLVPGLPGISEARPLDIAINVASTLVGAAVAILAWVRWRETGEPVALYESSAFVALTVINAMMVGIVIGGTEAGFGLSPASPGEAPVYLWTLTRLAAAYLLVVGATRSIRRELPPMPPIAIAVAPTIVLVVSAIMLFGREAVLPPVVGAGSFDPDGPGPLGLAPFSTAVAIGQLAIFGLFIVAAVLFRRLYLRDRLVSHAFLAAGLVVAAFSQLHFAISPVVAARVVKSSEALRLGFTAILFMGIQAELEADLSALRRANDELRRLGEVESANAALAERARLAREIHDGLAQDLWYAKLKQGRLTQDEGLADTARTTAQEVLGAIDSALAEARQAVMAMRADPTRASSLEEVLREYVDDFADRFGLRAEFRGDGAAQRLSPRTEAEVLRIVQEALNNVRRHADATLVRVSSERVDGRVRVTVADNGRGFDLDAVGADRYGLRGMRERAELVGATLEIVTRPADGTRVAIDIPAERRQSERGQAS